MINMTDLEDNLKCRIIEEHSSNDYDQFIVKATLPLAEMYKQLKLMIDNRYIKIVHDQLTGTHVITLFWGFSQSMIPFKLDTNKAHLNDDNNDLFQYWMMDREKFLEIYSNYGNEVSHERLIDMMRSEIK